jgi:hypothetical protein
MKNALQAVLDKASVGDDAAPAPKSSTPPSPKPARPPSARIPSRPSAPAAASDDVVVAEATPRFHRPSREDKRLVAGHFAPKVAKQLKLIAVEDDTTVQALLEEALDLLFAKKGRARIAELLKP